jgi:hypothetical protein
VARRIEERHPELDDRLVTAVEFGDQAVAPQMQILLRRLLNEVTLQTANVNFGRQVAAPYDGVWRILFGAALASLLIVIVGFLQPVREDLRNLFASGAGVFPGSLTVTPGDTSVRRGSTIKIEAQTPESSLDKATLYVSTGDTSWSTHGMLLSEPGLFAYEFFDVQDTLRYYVRAGNDLSPIFKILPLDAPVLRSIRLTYRYPAALGLPSKTTTHGGDVYGPAGTRVEITATFSAALSHASLQIGDDAPQPARVESDTVLSANLEINEDGFYRLLVSGANQIEAEAMEYFIRLLPDEAPEITLRRPGRDARVTMIEEVMVEAGVAEDFELKKFDLVYAINDKTPQRVNLLPHARRSKAGDDGAEQRFEFLAASVLYLEDFKVAPGDFISYYVEAADRGQSQTSDIYFVEVRPFAEEFHMAPSQGGSSGAMPVSLSISQKEIIVATWKLERGKLAQKEFEEKSRAIAEAQRGVRDTIEQLRMMLGAQGDGGPMGEYFDRAIEAMKRAEGELDAIRVTEALPPEREAYNYLLKADAEIRRRDLQRGRANAGAQAQSQEELQRLFADELDKMQSKYETLQNNQRRFEEKEVSEALEKVRQLAQRQEQLNDMNRQLARQPAAEEERRRQIARLHREQETLTREANELERRVQNLSRQSDQNGESKSSIAENLRQATEDMSRASNSLNRDNPESAAADGRRAVERLDRLEQQLRRSASQSMQQRLSDLQQDFRDLGAAQRQLADSLAQHGASVNDDQRRQWERNQQRLSVRADELGQRLLQSDRGTRTSRRAVQEALQNAAETWRDSDIPNRMQQAESALQNNRLDESERQQRQALRGIRGVEDELASVQSLLARSNEEKLDVALQQAQNLRRDLERQVQEQRNSSASGASRDAARPPQQQGTGTENQQGDSASRRSPSQQALKPEEMNFWQERMWQAMDQVNRMRPMVAGDSTLGESYSGLQRELNGFVRSFAGGDSQQLTDIESRLIEPLRKFEAELAIKLTLAQQRQRLASAQDEQVPPGYREMVDRYYEALARSKKSSKQ